MKFFIVFLLGILPFCSFGQYKYIHTQSNDTIRCSKIGSHLVKLEGIKRRKRYFFCIDSDKKRQEFPEDELRGYFDGQLYYGQEKYYTFFSNKPRFKYNPFH